MKKGITTEIRVGNKTYKRGMKKPRKMPENVSFPDGFFAKPKAKKETKTPPVIEDKKINETGFKGAKS